MKKVSRMLLAATLASVLWIGAAGADPASSAAAETTAPAKASSGQSAAKKKVIRLEAITVEGRIQKPQAFYILQRSTLNFDELNRSESFLPKVVKSVEREPF
jgi:hypothetical protein